MNVKSKMSHWLFRLMGIVIVNFDPLPIFALDGDVAAHEIDESSNDCEPSPVPPYLRVLDMSAWRNSSKM